MIVVTQARSHYDCNLEGGKGRPFKEIPLWIEASATTTMITPRGTDVRAEDARGDLNPQSHIESPRHTLHRQQHEGYLSHTFDPMLDKPKEGRALHKQDLTHFL